MGRRVAFWVLQERDLDVSASSLFGVILFEMMCNKEEKKVNKRRFIKQLLLGAPGTPSH